MSDEIINFYKKIPANEAEGSEKNTVQEPVSELVESKSLDPFENFLQTLASNIEKAKISEIPKGEAQITESTTSDPFQNFLVNVADIIKKDEKIQTDEQIKEATIGFINKLKDEELVKEEPIKAVKKQKVKTSYLPKKFLKKIPKNSVKEESATPVIQSIPTINLETGLPESSNTVVKEVKVEEVEQPTVANPYVKELTTADKTKKKDDKVTKPGDIKSLIEKQVREQINKLRQELGQAAMTAGGGGTVAATTDFPPASSVRLGTSYNNNNITGTLAVPPASAVSQGIAVNNTTGTAALTIGNVQQAVIPFLV